MTLTQCCCTDKIKRGDTGHGTKKYREEIKEGVQAGSVDPMALNNSSMNNWTNVDLKMDKTEFRCKKEYLAYTEGIIRSKCRHKADLETDKELGAKGC